MLSRNRSQTAIVVHVYHLDVWPELANKLEVLKGEWDFYLTLSEETAKQLSADLQDRFPQAKLYVFPNLGMDILPFFQLVPKLIDQGYQQVLKLHTKKGSTDFGQHWGELLLDALIGHPDAVRHAELVFEQKTDLSLLGPAPFFLSGKKLMLGNQQRLQQLAKALLDQPLPEKNWGFFAGSMFWTRPQRWENLANWVIQNSQAFVHDYKQDGQLSHALERVFGLVPAMLKQPVGLLHHSYEGRAPYVEIKAADQLLINEAGTRAVVQQYQKLHKYRKVFAAAGLLDKARYQQYLQKKGWDAAEIQVIDLITHYLLVGQFSGGRYCAQAWALRHQNHQIDWSALESKVRQPGLVSIVMPVFNQLALTQQAVQAVVKNTLAGSYELLLVDNGSDELTYQGLLKLEKQYLDVQVVRLEKNLFFALGSNMGFAQAQGEFAVFLNNDTQVQANWLPPLITALQQPESYAAQPLLLYPDGSVQCIGVVFSEKSTLGYPIYRGMSPDECHAEKPRHFQAITAACMAIRSELFATMQGFDPLYINGQEDVDFCLRLQQKSAKNATYVPSSLVIHHESKTSGRGKKIDQNRFVFVERWKEKVRADDLHYYQEDGFEVEAWENEKSKQSEISIELPKIVKREKRSSMGGSVGSKLKEANQCFREKKYRQAEKLYSQLLGNFPAMSPHLGFNIKLAKKRQGFSCSEDIGIQLPRVLDCPAFWEKRSAIIPKLGTLERPAEQLDHRLRMRLLEEVGQIAPSVSVIMPTWNRELSIERALNSIFAQSLQPLEVLICDDGSTDNTIERVRELYAEELASGKIRIQENPHLGVSAARNTGLAEARGELVAYLDSDNAWRPDYLLLMSGLFCENDELMCAYGVLQGHDEGDDISFRRADVFNRKRLIDGNFIDLNIFMHRHQLYRQYGGFDEEMRRLVDWDLIIRYTRCHEPAVLPYIGVDYYLDKKTLNNITFSESLEDNRRHVHLKCLQERIRRGNEPLRLGYVIWDFPALSQTFVMNELRWLVAAGVDVKVYFKIAPEKSAILDFEIAVEQVEDSIALAAALRRDRRNLCHSHFAYPAVTLLSHAACVEAGVHYTFMPHAVDIFHHENRRRNEIAKIANHPLCLKVFVYGNYHRDFLVAAGVDAEKIAYNMQAVDLERFRRERVYLSGPLKNKDNPCRAVVLARFIEKKGIEYLIEAAAQLKGEHLVFDLYGYGPLIESYRRRIKELGVNNIRFLGVVEGPEALARIYRDADMMLVPAVVAENGDMDGFPTVIMEAMAAGVPVITTDVSAIPDYITDGIEALVVPEKNSEALASAIQRLMAMSPARRQRLLDNARSFLARRTGTTQSMGMLMDTWLGRTVDIFMVTFNTPDYEDSTETLEIIRRVFAHTTTPYTLTIVDNGSTEDFLAELETLIAGRENVSLIRKARNVFCGPASNIALKMANSEYAIYLCSKEGFVSGHGWERPLIKVMDEQSEVAMAGHLASLPRYVYGSEYQEYPLFEHFRNPHFARENPTRIFRHIQGGGFILRRSVFVKAGGFSEAVCHNGMDVEYSYYLESLGYKLADLPEVSSVTVNTLPSVYSLIDENTALAHPLTIRSANKLLDPVVKAQRRLCNICGWLGQSFVLGELGEEGTRHCPRCDSRDSGRRLYRLLAADHRLHRQGKLAMLLDDPGFEKAVSERLFILTHSGHDEQRFLATLNEDSLSCIVVDAAFMRPSEAAWRKVLEALQVNGLLLVLDATLSGIEGDNHSELTRLPNCGLVHASSGCSGRYHFSLDKKSSLQVGYDWRPILSVTRCK